MSLFKFDYQDPTEMEKNDAPLTPGEATFKITGIYEVDKRTGKPLTTSDNTPKITLGLSIKDLMGNSGFMYDDLTSKTAWKIKALLDALGLGALYNKNGTLDINNLSNGEGRCEIGIKSYNGKDRMQIIKYIKAEQQLSFEPNNQDIEDEVPF